MDQGGPPCSQEPESERGQSKKTEAFYFEGLFWKVSDSHPISLWLICVRISRLTSPWSLHRGGPCTWLSSRPAWAPPESSFKDSPPFFLSLSGFHLDLSQFQLCVDYVIIGFIASSFQKADATIPWVPKTVSAIKRSVTNKCNMLKWIFRKKN